MMLFYHNDMVLALMHLFHNNRVYHKCMVLGLMKFYHNGIGLDAILSQWHCIGLGAIISQ